MTRHLARTLIAACAALLIATVSIASASLMAPDRGDEAAFQQALVLGVSTADICGDEADHDHRCPFCRLIADPPEMTPVAIALDLRPADQWRTLTELRRPLPGNPSHSPRAPPARA